MLDIGYIDIEVRDDSCIMLFRDSAIQSSDSREFWIYDIFESFRRLRDCNVSFVT